MVLNRFNILKIAVNPYLLLLYLSLGQAFILLRIDLAFWYKVLAAISGFAFYYLLIQISEKLFKLFLTISLVFSFFIFPAEHVYGFPDKNMISSVLYTNAGEAWSYIKIVPVTYYLILLFVFLYTLVLLFSHFKKVRNSYLTVSALLIVLAPVATYIFYHNESSFFDTDNRQLNIRYTYVPVIKIPLLIAIEGYQVMRVNHQIIEESRMPDNWEILNKNSLSLKKNIVIVIGESVRKDYMNCYGFPIDNTIFINSTPHFQFENCISSGAYTVPVLTRTLVYSNPFPQFNPADNIVNLVKKAGYKTYWFSNQGYIGIYDSPVSMIAEGCDHYFKYNGGDFHTAKLDTKMLPGISQVIKNDTNSKVIFVHMIGSHPGVTDRTLGKYDQFVLSKEISCYIQSIKNTDSFLSAIYEDLKQTNKSFGLIYFSDHGLKLNNSGEFVHSYETKETHDVPLLVWGNNIETSTYFKAFRNTNQFLELFCELYDIRTSNIKPAYKFISEDDADSSVFEALGEGSQVLDYRKFKRNPVPTLK